MGKTKSTGKFNKVANKDVIKSENLHTTTPGIFHSIVNNDKAKFVIRSDLSICIAMNFVWKVG